MFKKLLSNLKNMLKNEFRIKTNYLAKSKQLPKSLSSNKNSCFKIQIYENNTNYVGKMI